jgi:hypothetical protein
MEREQLGSKPRRRSPKVLGYRNCGMTASAKSFIVALTSSGSISPPWLK